MGDCDSEMLGGVGGSVIGFHHSVMQSYGWTLILWLWTLAVGGWYTARVLNAETVSTLLGIIFVPVSTCAAGLIVLGFSHWAHNDIRRFVGTGRGVSAAAYMHIERAVIAVYSGYTTGALAVFLSILPIALYSDIYVGTAFNDAVTTATIYPIVAPLTVLQTVFYHAEYFQLTMNMIISASFFLVLLTGPALHFDKRAAKRSMVSVVKGDILASPLKQVTVGAPTLQKNMQSPIRASLKANYIQL